MLNAEGFLEKLGTQTQKKKNIARVITFVVLFIAVFQELYLDTHLSDSWLEITTYTIMGYFGIATYRRLISFEKSE